MNQNLCSLCYKLLPHEEKIYHTKCIKNLFGVSYIPQVSFTMDDFPRIAQEMAGQMSISGVQPKISVTLDRKSKSLQGAPTGGEFILKPQNPSFPHLPENEDLCMHLATLYDIALPSHGLIQLADGSWAYLIKRFDRQENGSKLAVEDFTQILAIGDKYSGSYEAIGKGIVKFCTNPYLELTRFFERLIFCFSIGVGDMHNKNFSLITYENNRIALSPAYDLLSSKLVLPKENDLALTLTSKNNKVQKRDFLNFAEKIEIEPKAAANSLQRLLSLQSKFRDWIGRSYLPENQKEKLDLILEERFNRLE